MRSMLRGLAWRLLYNRSELAVANFNSWHYLRHNARRLEHLATLGLPLHDRSALEVGAGIGDHTSFYLDRGCQVVSTEGRPENFEVLRRRYPDLKTVLLDMDEPSADFSAPFDLVHCYGLLYHLKDPSPAIEFMARYCREMLLIETCVSFGDQDELNPCPEKAVDATQAVSGRGCRPTRRWLFNRLKAHFEFVYLPVTQPWHEEFPLDWTAGATNAPFSRAVFVASRTRLDNALLVDDVPEKQRRC